MYSLVEGLNSSSWLESKDELYHKIRGEMHGAKGLIKKIRNEFEEDRGFQLERLKAEFLSRTSYYDCDEDLYRLASDIFNLNQTVNDKIYYDLLTHVYKKRSLYSLRYPSVSELSKIFMEDSSINNVAAYRMYSIVATVVAESCKQSNRSNAGLAGEIMFESFLKRVGLKKGVHFKKQHKSLQGSDTDFVMPNVEDGRDQDVEIFMAVQVSSNDRARLASSELKPGGEKVLVTFNGVDVSTKKLKDIGAKIIQYYKNANCKMVCYGPEIDREIDRLKSQIKKSKNNRDDNENKLDYYENFAISFSEFADRLQKRYIRRTF